MTKFGEWQPISEAEKSEFDRVLLCRLGYAEHTVVGRWSKENACWLSVPGEWIIAATHFMPLPEPPQ